jgi:glutamyl-Q tRNA(Asp) synthetase
MEDLDPPREPPGAAELILASLRAHGLEWDGDPLWQSQRHDAYADTVAALLDAGQAFYCDCTRARLRAEGNVYMGRCRDRVIPPGAPAAVRVRVEGDTRIRIADRIQPPLEQELATEVGDFIILRKDGLYAYQLAVVLDDAWQGVTQVLRGYDLYDSTPRQVYLQRLLGLPTPQYAHIPVVTNTLGQKLSKQNRAAPVDDSEALHNLRVALRFLGQEAPSPDCRRVEDLLQRAIDGWNPAAIPGTRGIPERSLY